MVALWVALSAVSWERPQDFVKVEMTAYKLAESLVASMEHSMAEKMVVEMVVGSVE